IFGIKATTGRVARDSTGSLVGDYLAHEGPLSRTVMDAALLLDVISGPDPRDRFSQLGPPPAFSANLDRPLRPVRVAWSPDLGDVAVDHEYLEICSRAAQAFETVAGSIAAETPPIAAAGRKAWEITAPACTYVPERIASM